MGKAAFIEAGRIVNTHGVAGEVKIEVWVNSPAFLKACGRVYLGDMALKIESAREHKGFLLAKLEGVEDLNAAMALKGRELSIARTDAPLPPGGFFLGDLIGARVVDEEGREIGKLTEILERPASDIYVVQGEREHLIPAVEEFVRSVDADEGIVTVRLIEGM